MANAFDEFDTKNSFDQFDIGAPPAAPGFVPTVKRTAGQMLTGTARGIEDIAGQNRVATAIRDTGQGIIDRNPAGIQSLGDIVESPWLAVKEAVGNMVPQIGTGIVGARAGAALGSKIAGPRGAVVGGIGGGLAPIFTQEYGGIRDEQVQGGQESIPRALAAAAGATALERLGPEGRIIFEGIKNPLKRSAKQIAAQAGRDALVEGATEGAQNVVEQLGAFKDPSTPESLADTGLSAAMGAIGGGVVGGSHAALKSSLAPSPAVVAPVAEPVAQPVAAPGDPIRAAALPEAGPLTRGVNLLVEGEAQAADAGVPVPAPVAAALVGVPNQDQPHPDTLGMNGAKPTPDASATPGNDVASALGTNQPPAPAAGPLEAVAPQGGTAKPTFDPTTGEIAPPQRATWPTREAVQQYLTQQRVQGAARVGKAAPVELAGGGFSFIREGEPGYEEAAATKPPNKLLERRAAAQEAPATPSGTKSAVADTGKKAKKDKASKSKGAAPAGVPESHSAAKQRVAAPSPAQGIAVAAPAGNFQLGEKITGTNASGATLAGKFAGLATDGRVKLKQPGGNTHYVPAASVQRVDAPAAVAAAAPLKESPQAAAELPSVNAEPAVAAKSSLRERREKAIAERKAQLAAPQPVKGTSDEKQTPTLRPDAKAANAANADEGQDAAQKEVAQQTLAQRRAQAQGAKLQPAASPQPTTLAQRREQGNATTGKASFTLPGMSRPPLTITT